MLSELVFWRGGVSQSEAEIPRSLRETPPKTEPEKLRGFSP